GERQTAPKMYVALARSQRIACLRSRQAAHDKRGRAVGVFDDEQFVHIARALRKAIDHEPGWARSSWLRDHRLVNGLVTAGHVSRHHPFFEGEEEELARSVLVIERVTGLE